MARHSESTGKSSEVDSTTDKVQRRRLMKHMVEKRRRNRINDTLEKMRVLVLKSLNKNPENYNKMEKLDIMEMTTNFLYMLNQQKTASAHVKRAGTYPERMTSSHVTATPAANHSAHALQYQNGYATCQNEINNFFKSYELQQRQQQNINNAHIHNTARQPFSTLSAPNEAVMFSPIMQAKPTIRSSPMTSTPRAQSSDVYRPLHVTTSFNNSTDILNSSSDNAVSSSTSFSTQGGLLCTVSKEDTHMDINVEDISTSSSDSSVWRPW